MRVTYRPIGSDWQGENTFSRRYSPFRANWSKTIDQLEHELEELGAKEVVFQLDMEERDIRLDGMPRADAKPRSPRVIISFESKHGPLRYQCDAFEGNYREPSWQANVRAIALGLEALRQVERYGITKRGEQYTGWKALPESSQSHDEAIAFLASVTGWTPAVVAGSLQNSYRDAAKRLHPDVGGNRDMWEQLQKARQVLGI